MRQVWLFLFFATVRLFAFSQTTDDSTAVQEAEKIAAQRALIIKDSLNNVWVMATIEKTQILYQQNNFVEGLHTLTGLDTLSVSADKEVVVSYLKLKLMYPLFPEEESYQEPIEKTYLNFIKLSKNQGFVTEKIQEVNRLHHNFIDKLKLVEIERRKRVVVADIYQRSLLLFDNKRYADCLSLISRAEALAIVPDPKILYLKAKTLYPIMEQEEKYLKAIEQTLIAFGKVATQQNYDTIKIQELTTMQKQVADIKIKVAERKAQELAFFKSLSASSDRITIDDFLTKYPDSPYRKEVMDIRKKVNSRLYEEEKIDLESKLSNVKAKIGGNRALKIVGILGAAASLAQFMLLVTKPEIEQYDKITGKSTFISQVATSDYIIVGGGYVLSVMIWTIGGIKAKQWKEKKEDIEFQQSQLKNKYISLSPKINFQNGGYFSMALRLGF